MWQASDMEIRENVAAVMANISSAAKMAGRSPEAVRLVAVTKFVEEARIHEAIEAGITAVGENRVQEMQKKLSFFEQQGVQRHLIGQLQLNKVKYLVGKVKYIQSVDRLPLAAEIDRQAAKHGLVQDCLVEVNIGGEAQKGGAAMADLPELLALISAYPNIRIKGLMCIPPVVGTEEVRRYFAQMRQLFERLSGLGIPNVVMEELSMGMSGDYMTAIAEGATMVRVGTAIFGSRI